MLLRFVFPAGDDPDIKLLTCILTQFTLLLLQEGDVRIRLGNVLSEEF